MLIYQNLSQIIIAIISCVLLSMACDDETVSRDGKGGEGAGSEGGSVMTLGGDEAGAGGDREGEQEAGVEGGIEGGISGGAEGGEVVGGMTVEEECEGTCTILSSCFTEDDVCYLDEEGLTAFNEACVDRCVGFDPFAAVAEGLDTCEDTQAFLLQQIPEVLQEGCGEVIPDHSECKPFSDRLATCIGERCEPLASHDEALSLILIGLCVDGSAEDPEAAMFFQSVSEATPCDQPILEIFTGYFVEGDPNDPNSNGFSQYCSGGPLVATETCELACSNLRPCLPPDDPEAMALADPNTCQLFCEVVPEFPAELWTCLAGVNGCVDAGACFGAVEGDNGVCGHFITSVTRCITEECPSLTSRPEVLIEIARDHCVEALDTNPDAYAIFEGFTADTPCDDMTLSYFIEGLTTSTDETASGILAPHCASDIPLTPSMRCASICEQINPCVPESEEAAPYALIDSCAILCDLPAGLPEETWTCFESIDPFIGAEGCQEVLACVE